MWHLSLLFVLNFFVVIKGVEEVNDWENSCVTDVIRFFKRFDQQLSRRFTQKAELLRRPKTTYEEYENIILNLTSNGSYSTSEGTRDWITELLIGIREDYDLQKKSNAFREVRNLQELFVENSGYGHQIFYLMQLSGPLQHSWVIEQLPKKKGYRIYQSYTSAYSLNAWLNNDPNDIDTYWRNADIIYWKNNYDRLNSFLKKINHDIQNLETLPKHLLWIKPWLQFVKNYNKEQILKNFRKSWRMYGGGNIIQNNVLTTSYVPMLMNLTEKIKSLAGTTKPWTNQLNNDWITLFGSPNQFVFPNMPFITMTKTSKTQPVSLKIFPIKNVNATQILKNADILKKSLGINENSHFCSSSSGILTWNIFAMLLVVIATIGT